MLIGVGVLAASILAAGNAGAQHRGMMMYAPHQVPQMRAAPQYHQAPQMHYGREGPQGRRFEPDADQRSLGGVGRHGLAMLQGRRGYHEPHNRSRFAGFVPGALLGGAFAGIASIDIEQFIDSIDTSSPYEPVDGCTTVPCLWAAISMAGNGASQVVGGRQTRDDALSIALQGCQSVSQGRACDANLWATGGAWLAGLYCDRYDGAATLWQQAFLGIGNDLGAAIRNGYRTAASKGYAVDDCAWVNAISAEGSQPQFAQQE